MAEMTPLHDLTLEAGAVLKEFAFPVGSSTTAAEGQPWLLPDHYGNPAGEYQQVRTGAGLFDLSHRGKVEVAGPEALMFLHNLCTNEIKELPVGAGCEAFLTTNKARVVSHILVYHVQIHGGKDALWLDVEPGQAEPVIKHLDRYVISEQVEFSDRTRGIAQMHLAGPLATAILEKALADDVPLLEDLQHMVRTFGKSDTANIRKHSPLGVPGYDIVCLRDRAGPIWQMLIQAGAKPAGMQTFETLRIEAGTPVFGIDILDTTFAPEVGRTAQAICYTKGCYIGQEPIVMARDRGQINRLFLGLRLSDGPVAPGSKLYNGDKEVGWVTSSGISPWLGGAIALGYVRRGNWDAGTIVEVDNGGKRQSATVTSLPFAKHSAN